MSGVADAASMAFDAVGDVASWTGDLISGGVSMVAGPATSGFVGDVAGSALTQAAIGAGVGAGISAITGGDAGKGALYGAGAGAITGGLTGLSNNLNSSTAMTPSGGGQQATVQPSGSDVSMGLPSGGGLSTPAGGAGPAASGSAASTVSGPPTDPSVGFSNQAPGITFGSGGGGSGGMLPAAAKRANAISGNIGNASGGGYSYGAPAVFDQGGGQAAASGAEAAGGGGSDFLGGLMNSEMAGTAIAGTASGLLQGMAAEDQAEAARERDEAAARRTRENYGSPSGRGLLRTSSRTQQAGQPIRTAPPQQQSPAAQSPQLGGRYQYNRDTGQIELVPSA